MGGKTRTESSTTNRTVGQGTGMAFTKPIGQTAAARKYDLLTAMGARALAAQPGEQRLILRLMVAITARYNWASDTLAVGQAELARMWAVDKRTVKRAMAQFRQRGWLRLKRAAGRGRVAEYGLGLAQLMQDTRESWPAVGPDFTARMAPDPAPGPQPVRSDTVVPFPRAVPGPGADTPWARALDRFAQQNPALAQAWLTGAEPLDCVDGVLTLRVPGRFRAAYLRTHLAAQVLEHLRAFDPQVRALTIQGDG